MYRRSLAALACLYATLAALFALDAFRRPDQWAVDHAMPGGDFGGKQYSMLDSLVPLRHVHWDDAWSVSVHVVSLPGSFLVALALTLWMSRRLAAFLLAAVAIEAACKSWLDGPALYRGAVHISTFSSSFPSGHTLRIVILAGAAAQLWPRCRFAVLTWALAAIALLELAGWHTPTDVAGGLVLGALALLGGRAAGALRARRLPRAA